jgi:uncharacterized Rmd1/YagE family protein
MQATQFVESTELSVRALLVGERIDLRALESTSVLGRAPLTLSVGERGCGVLFRYGAVVLFDVQPTEELSFLQHLEPFTTGRSSRPEFEEARVRVDPGHVEGVEADGVIWIHRASIPHLQAIADVLGKSTVLAYYESDIAGVFDRIEPLAQRLREHASIGGKGRELLRHIGDVLSVQHKMVGRVAVIEKPELLWEHPELERLYARLDDEYELGERHHALDAKLVLVSRTAQTVLDLLQNKRSLRVEWYIVFLIAVEIALYLYEIGFVH